MSKNQEYAERYANFAMAQMRRYGIPASVTLAQGILESSNGQSRLAQKENNHFGIKATAAWIEGGGKYGLYTDDKPDEKFCSYATVGDSYEHHSRFLKENKRYADCFKLAADDYKGWAQGLERAGYATGGNYAANLQRIIEVNGLDKYDRMVMEAGISQGKAATEHYSFPVERNEFLLVTSPFGMRRDPMNPDKQQIHKGIDIQTNQEAVLATEDKGKVVAVNQNADTPGGRSVTVEYERADNSKVQVSYHHLEVVGVKTGDTVNAGQLDEYFAEKRDVIAAAEELLGQNEAQLAELVEEQADNYLDEDNFPDSKMTDANVKKRIKALDKRTDAEEIAVLQKYLDLKGDISLNKKLIKERKYDLLTALVVKYADLSEAEIKRLVIEKKWFTSLALRLDCEMQRISQQLTSKVLALAERYAQTLPEIDADITDLEAKVAAHLKQMGY